MFPAYTKTILFLKIWGWRRSLASFEKRDRGKRRSIKIDRAVVFFIVNSYFFGKRLKKN